jgi:hypothetical protein
MSSVEPSPILAQLHSTTDDHFGRKLISADFRLFRDMLIDLLVSFNTLQYMAVPNSSTLMFIFLPIHEHSFGSRSYQQTVTLIKFIYFSNL